MKVYGYCRISTSKQNIERQERNILKSFPDAIIIKETFTGTKYQGRRELEKVIAKINSGDTIVFDSVSRMSRNSEEGFSMYEDLYNRGVQLVFLKEPQINTEVYQRELQRQITVSSNSGDKATDELIQAVTSALNNYIMALAKRQIQLAFEQSQKEVDDLHQRTREGIETARRNGKQIGQTRGRKLVIRKEAPIKELILKYSRDFGGSNTDNEVRAIINGSVYKYSGEKEARRLHVSNNTYYKYKSELKSSLR